MRPVIHKGLHQGWTQISLYLQVIHFTSHYTTSLFFSDQSSNSVHNFRKQTQKNNKICFGAYLYSAGTQRRNLHRVGWAILLCGSAKEPVLATDNTGKTQERFWKIVGEWTGRVEINKEEILVNFFVLCTFLWLCFCWKVTSFWFVYSIIDFQSQNPFIQNKQNQIGNIVKDYTVSNPWRHIIYTVRFYILRLYCSNKISPMGISGCLPCGKPGETKSRYPTHGARWVF